MNLTIILICFILNNLVHSLKYEPNWDSLDSRKLPTWYDQAKIGIFIHWSVWSVASAGFDESAFLWEKWKNNETSALDYMRRFQRADFTYPEFASSFKAEFYDPAEWVDIFNSSGAKYIVFVSKHHEGYCMWPSKHAFNWNSVDVGPKRDLLGELFKATREKSGLKIGIYYSLYEWYNELYLSDKSSNFTKNDFIQNKMLPDLKELILNYKPEIVWSDGDWESYSEYWKSKEFLTWLYNESPVKDSVVVNDRWGIDTLCKHGGFLTCSDKYNPGHLLERKWENAMTLDLTSWGYKHNVKLENIISIEELIKDVIITVSCGGNILINVGPTAQGKIPVIFEERLRQLGKWLKLNGESIYETKPWKIQNDPLNPDVIWYTSKTNEKENNTYVYALSLVSSVKLIDESMVLTIKPSIECSKVTNILLLGYNKQLEWYCSSSDVNNVNIIFSNIRILDFISSQWAWSIRLEVDN